MASNVCSQPHGFIEAARGCYLTLPLSLHWRLGYVERMTSLASNRRERLEKLASRKHCEFQNVGTQRFISHPPNQQAPNPPEFAQPRVSRAKWHRSNTPRFVASRRGNTSHIGTNTPKFVPSRWGWLSFDPLKPGCANSGGFGARWPKIHCDLSAILYSILQNLQQHFAIWALSKRCDFSASEISWDDTKSEKQNQKLLDMCVLVGELTGGCFDQFFLSKCHLVVFVSPWNIGMQRIWRGLCSHFHLVVLVASVCLVVSKSNGINVHPNLQVCRFYLLHLGPKENSKDVKGLEITVGALLVPGILGWGSKIWSSEHYHERISVNVLQIGWTNASVEASPQNRAPWPATDLRVVSIRG